MNQKISFTPRDLRKIYESGYFLNPSLPIDFQIDRFADRSHLLTKDYSGITALVNWYGFSLDTLDQSSEFCHLIVTTEPVERYKDIIPQYIVRDLRLFMFKLAQYMRQRYGNPFIAVTGTVGKSTTSKMISHLIKDETTETLVNMGNHNNRPSVSFYTANLISNPDYMVLEIAGDSFLQNKSLGNLAELAKPDIGLVTSIGGAHLSRYKDNLTVAKIKSRLIDGMKPGGTLVINGDIQQEQIDVFIRKAQEKNIEILKYSMYDKTANAYLMIKRWDGEFSVVQANVMDEVVTFRLSGGADGTIQNSLGVLLILKHLGIQLSEERLKKFENSPMLKKVLARDDYELPDHNQLTIIDDTHNSSVPAMHNIIDYFKMLATSGIYNGKKLLVLSKIADLGPKSQEIHLQFVQPIAEAQADFIFLYGDQMKELMKKLRKMGILAYHYTNLDEMVEEVIELIEDKSLVVMKGSVSESDFSKISWKLPQKITQLGGKKIQK